jgi:uncharacterized protein (DUF433 family)
MDWHGRIEVRTDVLTGKPVIKGTRLSVDFVLGLLADGWTEGEILEDYPGLVVEDIRACLAYASSTLAAEKIYPIAV